MKVRSLPGAGLVVRSVGSKAVVGKKLSERPRLAQFCRSHLAATWLGGQIPPHKYTKDFHRG